ncbi:hypothetical protein [Mycobacterium sp. NPDC006124]|uniref:hypothetical protein n=1 Tax=Mycobacterium sp. NPDC006124 TaxID=3156729 RepID=UPI0033A7A43B
MQQLLGLFLGAISAVAYPGMYVLLFLAWIIPGVIALLLQISPRTRSLAVGFAAASLGWLCYYVAFYVYVLVAAALQ